jgi:hypothetical protein
MAMPPNGAELGGLVKFVDTLTKLAGVAPDAPDPERRRPEAPVR